jgi:hypothetical protein
MHWLLFGLNLEGWAYEAAIWTALACAMFAIGAVTAGVSGARGMRVLVPALGGSLGALCIYLCVAVLVASVAQPWNAAWLFSRAATAVLALALSLVDVACAYAAARHLGRRFLRVSREAGGAVITVEQWHQPDSRAVD